MIDAVINGNFMMRSEGRGVQAPHRFILVKTPGLRISELCKICNSTVTTTPAGVRRAFAQRGRIPLEKIGASPISCPCMKQQMSDKHDFVGVF